jgi:phage baseplate assembly protein W
MKQKHYNIKFPITDSTDKNYLFKMNTTTKDAVSSDIYLLLVTEKYQRYYKPSYGTNFLRFIFEQNDEITKNEIISNINDDISIWLPNIRIIDFNTNTENNEMIIDIKFTYTEESLTYVDSFNFKIITI